jgi:hypothetical protein
VVLASRRRGHTRVITERHLAAFGMHAVDMDETNAEFMDIAESLYQMAQRLRGFAVGGASLSLPHDHSLHSWDPFSRNDSQARRAAAIKGNAEQFRLAVVNDAKQGLFYETKHEAPTALQVGLLREDVPPPAGSSEDSGETKVVGVVLAPDRACDMADEMRNIASGGLVTDTSSSAFAAVSSSDFTQLLRRVAFDVWSLDRRAPTPSGCVPWLATVTLAPTASASDASWHVPGSDTASLEIVHAQGEATAVGGVSSIVWSPSPAQVSVSSTNDKWHCGGGDLEFICKSRRMVKVPAGFVVFGLDLRTLSVTENVDADVICVAKTRDLVDFALFHLLTTPTSLILATHTVRPHVDSTILLVRHVSGT